MQNYDIVIIGSGPAGYVAAIRAAQLGAKVCVIEKDTLGGTCLNRGCIPTKALYSSIEALSYIKRAKDYGIRIDGGFAPDFGAMLSRAQQIVIRLRDGISFLFKRRNIVLMQGLAKILSPDTVLVNEEKLKAKFIIIATGSSPIEIPGFISDGSEIISSDDIFRLKEIPKSILIIGGGVIGCEWADIFSSLGSNVVMVEICEQILPNLDAEVARKLETNFKNKGVKIFTKTKAQNAEKQSGSLKSFLSNGELVESEMILVSVGRKSNISGLGLEELGVKIEKNAISVDKSLRTNINNIFAAGDVIGGYFLAHVASYEGVIAVENALGSAKETDYSVVPNCIFVDPPIACVGITETDAKKEGIDIEIGKFPFSASGKANAMGRTEGFVKLIAERSTKRLLGAQIFGVGATEMIAQVSLGIKLGIKIDHIIETIHAHPTLPETIQEAAYSIYKNAIHII